MKKILALVLAASLLASLFAGCSKRPMTGETNEDGSVKVSVDLVIFAAASMTETLTKLGEMYKKDHPEVNIIFNFESSGTLKTQIEEEADCDLFISAAPKQMNQLDITCDEEKNPDRLDYVDHDTRLDLLENETVLVVPEGTPKGIQSFDDLAAGLQSGAVLLAMGGPDVPVGQYTQKILAYLGLDEDALAAAGNISYGQNVKAVTTQVSEGLVDCGIIYRTDASAAGLTVVASATEEMCGRVIYPAAVLKTANNPDAARDFLAFLQSPEAAEVFREAGFTPLTGN